ncbi:MAG: RHS repeat-associated core domain-containing protein [Candidatus Altiarchaeota archaeon]
MAELILLRGRIWVYSAIVLLLMVPVAWANELSPEWVRPVSVVESSGGVPGYAIDGSTGSEWYHGLSTGVPYWALFVDLNATYKIHGVRIYSSGGGNGPCGFRGYVCNSSSVCGSGEDVPFNWGSGYGWYSFRRSSNIGSMVKMNNGKVVHTSNPQDCGGYHSQYADRMGYFFEIEANVSAFGPGISGFAVNQSTIPMGQAAVVNVSVANSLHTFPISKAWFTVDGNVSNVTGAAEGVNSMLWTNTMLPRSQYTVVGYVNDTKNHITASTPVTVFIETTTTTVTTSTTTTLALGPQNYVNNYSYDDNGNMLEDEKFKYEYNGMNMLKTVKNTTNDAIIEQYWYGPDGQRIKKVSFLEDGSNRTTYYVTPSYEIEYNETGARKDTRYVFANGERMAELHQNGSKTYYLNDHLGSSSVLVNELGEQLDRLTYYPYGEVKTGGDESKYGYNNKELDSTGLNYYGARYYNPELKRWTQPDTIIPNPYDPQSLNRYSYVKNNPEKYIDPTGHFAFLPIVAAMGIGFIAGVASYGFNHIGKDDWSWSEAAGYGVVGAAAGAAICIGAAVVVAAGAGAVVEAAGVIAVGFMANTLQTMGEKTIEQEDPIPTDDENYVNLGASIIGFKAGKAVIAGRGVTGTGSSFRRSLPWVDKLYTAVKMNSGGKNIIIHVTFKDGSRGTYRVTSATIDEVIDQIADSATQVSIQEGYSTAKRTEIYQQLSDGNTEQNGGSSSSDDGDRSIYKPYYLGGYRNI